MIAFLERRGYEGAVRLVGGVVAVLVAALAVGGWLAYRDDVRQAHGRVDHESAQRVALLEVVAQATRPGATPLTVADSSAWFGAFVERLEEVVADPRGAARGEEFVVARARGDSLEVVLTNHRDPAEGDSGATDRASPGVEPLPTVPLAAERASAFRRALAGETGTARGTDLWGHDVVVAYRPGPFGLAVVADIPLADLRSPFLSAGTVIFSVIVILAVLTLVFLRRIEDQATRSRRFLSTLLDCVHGGVVGVDRTGRVILMNRTAETFVGTDLRESAPADWFELVEIRDPATGLEYREDELPVSRALAGEEVTEVELEVRPKGAAARRLLVSATPLLDDAGTHLGAAATWIDATERLEAQREIEASRERLSLALEAAQQGLYDLDLRTGKVVVSDEYATMLGYDPATFVETNPRWIERMHPDDRALAVRRFQEYLAGHGERFEAEFRQRTRSGAWRWILSQGKIVERDGDGRPLRMLGIHTDITRRKQAEEDRDRLSQAIEQAGEMVMITDRDGSIRYVNPAFELITGYSRSDVLGQNPRILKSGEHDDDFYADLWKRLGSGETVRTTFVNRRKDGELYTQSAVISPFRDRTGSVVGYATVARDVTRERKLEDQLREADKLRALGQLAGGIAHDFNNELTVVLANARLGLAGISEGDPVLLQDALREIHGAARRASDLTESLLTFARRSPMERRPTELAELLEGVAATLRRVLPESIEVVTAMEAGGPTVLVDPGVVRQILLNLATNARDAMPDGGRLELRAERAEIPRTLAAVRPPRGAYARVSVSDTGRGIPPHLVERVFEPFFTTKDPGKGTGLGLAMVYAQVEQAEGYVDVTSVPGEGTTFHLYFPLTAERADAQAPDEVEVALPPPGRGEHILLAEDEDALRNAARRTLERAGYRVTEARNGEEAWTVFQARGAEVDLVLSDLVMPRMGGRELLESIRQVSPGTRMILTSGHARAPFSGDGDPLGHVPFLPKPWSGDEMLHAVRSGLDGPEGPPPVSPDREPERT